MGRIALHAQGRTHAALVISCFPRRISARIEVRPSSADRFNSMSHRCPSSPSTSATPASSWDCFAAIARRGFPSRFARFALATTCRSPSELAPWLADDGRQPLSWWIASVNRPAATWLIDWLGEHRRQDRLRCWRLGDLPLRGALERPGHGGHRPAAGRRGRQSVARRPIGRR